MTLQLGYQKEIVCLSTDHESISAVLNRREKYNKPRIQKRWGDLLRVIPDFEMLSFKVIASHDNRESHRLAKLAATGAGRRTFRNI